MASSRLLKKILSDFLFRYYLLNYRLKHATNHIQNRCAKYRATNRKRQLEKF